MTTVFSSDPNDVRVRSDLLAVGNQERYLLAERFTEASYPIPFTYRVRGRLDVARLQSAIDTIVGRHDILRSSFRPVGSGFVASIAPKARIELVQVAGGHSERETRAQIAAHFAGKIRDFTPEAFTRVLLITVGPDEHVLTLSLHHAIADGISMDIFAREIFQAYEGVTAGAPVPGYYDLATPVSEQDRRGHEEFWAEYLGDVDNVTSLQPDLNHPEAGTGEIVHELELQGVEALASHYGVTPFNLMSTISAVILGRTCNSDDLLFTFQSSGRKLFAQSNETIGPFSNTIVLRTRLAPAETLQDLVSRQEANIAEALRHEACPYHHVVRETGVQPRFGLNWFPAGYRPSVAGVEFSEREFLFYESNYELNIRFIRLQGALQLLIHYDARLFSRDRVEAIAVAFNDVLAMARQEPASRIDALLPPPRPLIALPNPAGNDEPVFDAFVRHAGRDPDRIALVGVDAIMTYGQVDRASRMLAQRLVAAGFAAGARIGILAERGPKLVWTMIGVLRSGATMVPLDSSYPEERLRTLVEIAGISALLMPRDGLRPEWISPDLPLIVIDEEGAEHASVDVGAAALAPVDPDAAAYMLFTSGSTGTPKCIATSHRPIINFLRWQRETFSLGENDRFTNLCGIAHDMMIRDIFAPLSIGARLAIPDQDDIFRPGALLAWCNDQRPTVSHLTPVMGRLLLLARHDGQTLPLRLMFFGGDRLVPELVEQMGQLAPDAEIVNFYGTTETPQAAGFHRCRPESHWLTYPIGSGVDHCELRIVDAAHQPVADGAPGEIAVVTPFLSLGYVHDGEICPHERPGIYFTGDTGFQLPSGDIMFAGRSDDQISIRGYRIELEEISAALRAHPDVRNAVALPYGPPEDRRIAAFIVPVRTSSNLKKSILTQLATRLPQYMLPNVVEEMEALPLLPNGKLDRRSLQDLAENAQSERAAPPLQDENYPRPVNAVEAAIISSWSGILGRKGISTDDSFQDLSGDSLSYVQAYLAVEEAVGSVPEGWQFCSIHELVAAGSSGVRWGRVVDTALAIRAISISMVVAWHFHLIDYDRGVTSSLFLVSGLLFGSFQLVESIRLRSAKPVMQLLGRLLLPVIIFTMFVYAMRTIGDHPTDLGFLLFYENLFNFGAMTAAEAARHEMVIWYIHCSIQIMFFLAFVLTVVGRFSAIPINRFRLSAALFLAGCVTRFLMPAAVVPGWLAGSADGLTAVSYLPTTHISTFMLGSMIASARTSPERRLTVFALLAYVIMTFYFLNSSSWIFLLVGGALLLFLPQVRLPKFLAHGVFLVSGASLFIYLTHIQAMYLFKKIGLGGYPVVGGLLAIAIGVVAWKVWDRLFIGLRAVRSREDSEKVAANSL